MSDHLRDYTGFEVHELVAVLATPLGRSHYLRQEILSRDPVGIVQYLKEVEDGLEKTLLANFIIEESGHFEGFISLDDVKPFSDKGVVPSVKRGLRGDLSVGVEDDDDQYEGRVSLTGGLT